MKIQWKENTDRTTNSRGWTSSTSSKFKWH